MSRWARRERLLAAGGATRTFDLTPEANRALVAKALAAGMSEQAYICHVLTGPAADVPSPTREPVRAGLTPQPATPKRKLPWFE